MMNNEQEEYHHTQLPVSPDSVIMRSVIKKAPPNDEQIAPTINDKSNSDMDVETETVIATDVTDVTEDDETNDMDDKMTDITSSEEGKLTG